MTEAVFTKPFTQQEAIPDAGVDRAVEIMKSGRMHRYNLAGDEDSEASCLEMEYAKWQGADYCLACTSGGYAIQLALRVCGVKPGDRILANAYTLAPVPGAIHNVGAHPILVDIDENYHIDLEDLDAKAAESDAKFLLLSHMRGHIADLRCSWHLSDRGLRAHHGGQMAGHSVRQFWQGRRLLNPDIQTHEFRRGWPADHE